jgi:hypothetical protein
MLDRELIFGITYKEFLQHKNKINNTIKIEDMNQHQRRYMNNKHMEND